MKVLMVITSHDQLGNTGRKTGFWLEELAAPYYVFKDAGVEITLASPKGGRPPLDPKSDEPKSRTELTIRFEKDAAAEAQLGKTVRLDSVKQEDFDTVFYPGGHGPMWDLAEDEHSTDRVFHRCRQANRHRVPFHRGAASRQDRGRQVSGSRQGSYRLH
jgi:putative intracellular protease/amidase